MYISHKFLKSSVNKLLEFRHISKINTCIFLSMWQLKHCFDLSHLYIHTQTREHTHTHTHTHTGTRTLTLTQIKIWQFFGKIAKSNTRAIETILAREI